ncbi:copper homeostasis membrane protein CopD [uncultured Sphingomonas sp.]|uniref:copper homeostasis membrane protein CopD n=1 Tax=uncultured Sphingomonas sp. TaxID=158754 RepID=UPI0025ED06E6|nr:copper homeostasis membrane protein CopD [uncultured Sphingomonas sp.]
MDDWGGVAARFSVYLTLCFAFGIPLQAAIDGWRLRRRWLLAMTMAASVTSVIALLFQVAEMAGTATLSIDRDLLWTIIGETSLGTAFVVRFVALGVAVAGALCGYRAVIIVCGASGVALSTVAWTGHGAMQDGVAGTWHLIADVAHLLAGGAWLGAIALLLSRLVPVRGATNDLATALHRFTTSGSVLVATIVLSGAINVGMILGMQGVATLPFTLYGRLLLTKLCLFIMMLLLAARHRWWLGPRLRATLDQGDPGAAAHGLRRSLALELGAGVVILALVAWLGTLSPSL